MKKIKLDAYEQQIEDDLAKGEFQLVPNHDEEVKRYRSYFKAAAKNRRISIRIAQNDLVQIQKRAAKSGIPYQTLVTAILHQYVEGNLKIQI